MRKVYKSKTEVCGSTSIHVLEGLLGLIVGLKFDVGGAPG